MEGEKSTRLYSKTIWVCNLKCLFSGGKEKVFWKSAEELPIPCANVGVCMVRKFLVHVFGGISEKGKLDFHVVYDARELIRKKV